MVKSGLYLFQAALISMLCGCTLLENHRLASEGSRQIEDIQIEISWIKALPEPRISLADYDPAAVDRFVDKACQILRASMEVSLHSKEADFSQSCLESSRRELEAISRG